MLELNNRFTINRSWTNHQWNRLTLDHEVTSHWFIINEPYRSPSSKHLLSFHYWSCAFFLEGGSTVPGWIQHFFAARDVSVYSFRPSLGLRERTEIPNNRSVHSGRNNAEESQEKGLKYTDFRENPSSISWWSSTMPAIVRQKDFILNQSKQTHLDDFWIVLFPDCRLVILDPSSTFFINQNMVSRLQHIHFQLANGQAIERSWLQTSAVTRPLRPSQLAARLWGAYFGSAKTLLLCHSEGIHTQRSQFDPLQGGF